MRTEDHPAAANGSGGSDSDFAHRFVTALAGKNAAALLSMFGREVDFRAVTPGRFWEASTAQAVTELIFGTWFGPGTEIERIESIGTGMVGKLHTLEYRLRLVNPGGKFLVEQHAFADLTGGKITSLRLACSGFIPAAEI